MAIKVSEHNINDAKTKLGAIRIAIPDAVGGGAGGMPFDVLAVLAGNDKFEPGKRIRTEVSTTGGAIDNRLTTLSGNLDRYITALTRFQDETDNVESMNAEQGAELAALAGGGPAA